MKAFKNCKSCGKSFDPKGTRRIYCTKECKPRSSLKKKCEECSLCLKEKRVCTRRYNKPICCDCLFAIKKEKCTGCSFKRSVYTRINIAPFCKSCGLLLNQGFTPEEITARKGDRKVHHHLFEKEFPQAVSEVSLSMLAKKGLMDKFAIQDKGSFRYDFFLQDEKILVELNEPSHYHFDLYKRVTRGHGDRKSFDKYKRDFSFKVDVAEKSGLKVVIIDCHGGMSKHDILKSFGLLRKVLTDDGKNTIDPYRYWKTEAIKAELDTKRHNFSTLICNFGNDFNIGSVIRNSNAFLGKAVYIYGRKRFDRRGTVGTHHYENLIHINSLDELPEGVIVAVDNVPGAVAIDDFEWPTNEHVIMAFGQEQIGLREDVISMAKNVVYIRQYGSVRSLNVACAAAIAMQDYCRKNVGDGTK